jgi:hypothetical protein
MRQLCRKQSTEFKLKMYPNTKKNKLCSSYKDKLDEKENGFRTGCSGTCFLS